MTAKVHSTLVVIRHGKSYSNLKHIYSGWYDTDLTEKGISESKEATEILREKGKIRLIISFLFISNNVFYKLSPSLPFIVHL